MIEEKVLCFKRSLLDKVGSFQGISLDIARYFPVVTAPGSVRYLLRERAELDKRYKQIIPYALIVCGDRILRYRRGQGSLEGRLRGAYSAGVGGHIREEGNGLFSSGQRYADAMRRELLEEIPLNIVRETAVAVINDDSTEVGSVHFGVVHVVQVSSPNIAACRGDNLGHEFVPMNLVVKNPHTYEPWSRFCLENLYPLLARATPRLGFGVHAAQPDQSMIQEILERRLAFGI
jgi:predicted NUDIX family phosphoesterase